MSTETSSSMDQTSNALKRILKSLIEFINRNSLPIKRSEVFMFDHESRKESSTSIYELSIQIQGTIKDVMRRCEEDYKSYQKTLQFLQDKLRKHTKIEIQFKLYYEHLQQIIEQLKKDRHEFEQKLSNLSNRYQTQIVSLQTQLTQYKNMITIDQPKSIDGLSGRNNPGQKMDTISKIKNRLFCIDTGDYGEQKLSLSNLNSKRQSLVKQIQDMYNAEPKSRPQSRQSSLNNSFKKTKQTGDRKINTKSKKKLSSKKNSLSSIAQPSPKKEKKMLASMKFTEQERPASVTRNRKSMSTFKKGKQV